MPQRWPDEQIRDAFDFGLTAIARIRRRFIEQGPDGALHRRPPGKSGVTEH